MFVKKLANCAEIIANDGCRLRETLHPDHDSVDLPYSFAFAWVDPGERTYPHSLQRQTEVYVILQGCGRMHIDDEAADVEVGDSIVIPAGSNQWIENAGPDALWFAAIVSPPWQAEDDVRL